MARPEKRRKFLRWPWLLLLLAVIWCIGLFWYATLLPFDVEDRETETDAIVVLTGGSNRIQTGLALLQSGIGKKLFVSGVYHGVEVNELLTAFQESLPQFKCCVVLGYEADNTHGNAIETSGWLTEEGYQSLRLVTAAYHMPRSLLEFERAMPGIKVIPHPVFPETFKHRDWWLWPGSARLLISEYNKYLVALFFGVLRKEKA